MDTRLIVLIGLCLVILVLAVSMWPGSRQLKGQQKYRRSDRTEVGDSGPDKTVHHGVWGIMFPALFGGSHSDTDHAASDGDASDGGDGGGGDGGGD